MQNLTIALCTYNGARYLDAQLQSLRVQMGVNEIVIVDDRSTDDTWAILQQHAVEDPRLRLFQNATQLGVTRNFERAIGLAHGEWIALADQDDVWLPTKLARLRAAWDGEACLVHHATRKFRGAVPTDLPSPAGERRKFSGSDVRRLLYRNSVVGHTVLVRADVARRLAPFPAGVPHDWWLGVGSAVLGRVQYVDEYLVHYRIHRTNAFHAAGSRWRRARAESGLRLEILRALEGWPQLPEDTGCFVRRYRSLLVRSERGTFPWALWRFYFRHAALFFGGGAVLSPFRRLRKSCLAALGAMWQAAPAVPADVVRPGFGTPIKPADAPLLRRTA